MFERLLNLITEDELNIINNKKILLVGVGGVGGYALESLVRSGFRDITIIDGDDIAPSNLNRQIVAKIDNIGKSKVNEAKMRMESINSDVNIKIVNTFLSLDNFESYINQEYDYILDCIDDIKIKVELIKYANKKNIKIISSLGMGRKIDASKVVITRLDKTFNDPLAKKLRYLLRSENINLKIPVVFSSEDAIDVNEHIGSAIFVPSVAGILIANYIFLDIIKPQV